MEFSRILVFLRILGHRCLAALKTGYFSARENCFAAKPALSLEAPKPRLVLASIHINIIVFKLLPLRK